MFRRVLEGRSWTLGPPEVSWDAGTLSGSLALHCAYPPWNEQLSLETDEAELEQARALVDALKDASTELGAPVTLYLDRDEIGEIQNGVPERGISEVLLGEWERVLVERREKAKK
jgi:hypothetical protein